MKLIWASTTVVLQGEIGSFVGDDVKYNAIAARVMENNHIEINDLYTTSKTFPPSMFTKPAMFISRPKVPSSWQGRSRRKSTKS